MPTIESLSEFNRNQNAMITQLKETKEPIYLTKNGSACIVVMDAAAFDEQMSFRDEILEHEMRVYNQILQGKEEALNGEGIAAREADIQIRKAKGWTHER